MIFDTTDTDRTLFDALCEARHMHGGKALVVEDVKREPLSYNRLITAAELLGARLVDGTRAGRGGGRCCCPMSRGVAVAFFALQAQGRVPAMLNFTVGLANMRVGLRDGRNQDHRHRARLCRTGQAGAISSPRWKRMAGASSIWRMSAQRSARRAKLWAALTTRRAAARHRTLAAFRPTTPAVILFTSGSEGTAQGRGADPPQPARQLRPAWPRGSISTRSDVVLNALPVFHSFGLTGGTLLPLLNGIRTVLYPSPLHYRIVPALAYDANATILFGTDTFLSGYARMAHGYDFYSLRYIFAGAERVRDETRRAYAEKFGLRILEGYGATEAAPVIAVNTPMHFQAGSRSAACCRRSRRGWMKCPASPKAAACSMRGPNVMAGYFLADAPGVLQPPEGGWHDTGDIVTIDEAGFVTIRGRAKRFAKIGGEMVSLPAVEGYAAAAMAGVRNMRSSPGPTRKKGEQLVLFTTAKDAMAKALQDWGKANGIAELAIPRDIRVVETLPVLGTGKLDYMTLNRMVV